MVAAPELRPTTPLRRARLGGAGLLTGRWPSRARDSRSSRPWSPPTRSAAAARSGHRQMDDSARAGDDRPQNGPVGRRKPGNGRPSSSTTRPNPVHHRWRCAADRGGAAGHRPHRARCSCAWRTAGDNGPRQRDAAERAAGTDVLDIEIWVSEPPRLFGRQSLEDEAMNIAVSWRERARRGAHGALLRRPIATASS